MSTTKYQAFTPVTIQREKIKNAPYNPRKINDKARLKLKKNIKKVGLVETLVVNKRTMNLVSGHQRIAILDSLEGSQDYSITVAMIDVDEKTEKEQNIFLNNANAQGEYDIDMLKTSFADIDFLEAGFDLADVSYFKAEEVVESEGQNISEEEEDLVGDIAEIQADKDARKAAVKEVKAQMAETSAERGEKFVVITFRSVSEKDDFLLKYGFPEIEKYIDAYTLERIIKGQ